MLEIMPALRRRLRRAKHTRDRNFVHVMYEVDLRTLDEPALGTFSSEEKALAFVNHHRGSPDTELRWQSVPLRGEKPHEPNSGELIYLVSDGGPSDDSEATNVSAVAIAAFRSRDAANEFVANPRETRYVSDPRVLSIILDVLE